MVGRSEDEWARREKGRGGFDSPEGGAQPAVLSTYGQNMRDNASFFATLLARKPEHLSPQLCRSQSNV